jgi:hypothetical protein
LLRIPGSSAILASVHPSGIDFTSLSSDNELQEGFEMTIQLEISPETEAWLAAEAAAQCMDLPSFAAALLEQSKPSRALGSPISNALSKRQRPIGQKSLAQLFAESPFKGLNLDFEADRELGRDDSL